MPHRGRSSRLSPGVAGGSRVLGGKGRALPAPAPLSCTRARRTERATGRQHRRLRRRWSWRGRRGQVSAVATVLGLLLVVTLIANYLSTQLPGQMRVNDANHVLTVENQVLRFAAVLRAASAARAVGAVLTQPVSLGSAGEPPMAPPDGASIGPGGPKDTLTYSYTVVSSGSHLSGGSSAGPGAALVTDLRNTYIPRAVVAFDQGAVVFAQPNGLPVMLLGPSITYWPNGTLVVWVPEFYGAFGTEAGVGTAEISARLTSVQNVYFPKGGYSLSGATSIIVTTPYASAWLTALNGVNSTVAGHAVCIPRGSVVCTGPFAFNGPSGTVYINVTAKALALQVAQFTIGLS